ncbi:MAG: tetratricopeptide repeat protein [Betaproteobacteria bacterium]|nr:tetratricopeptide repeat protein [Betaproteobacteria bacterium]
MPRMLKDLLRQLLTPGTRRRAGAHETGPSPGVVAPGRGLQDRLTDALDRQQRGDLSGAEQAYRSILRGEPRHFQALHLLGHVLTLQARFGEAVEVLSRVAALAPEDAEARFNLARALRAQGRSREAEQALRGALRLQARFTAAWLSLAGVLSDGENLDEAEDCYRAALELEPELAEAQYNYGNLLHREGRIEEAIGRYRKALELKPDFVRAHSNLIYALNFSADYSPEQIFGEHVEWARRHAKPLASGIRPHANSRRPHRVLRVGYVSANFRDHAVTYFFEPVLMHHEPGRVAVHCYSDVRQPDGHTERLRRYRCVWRDIAGQGDEAVAELVRSDEIDILVDLTGHTDNHRLLVFARKPAPVQVTWNGYANTTGMETMDYRITDSFADPPGMTEHLHSEKLVRLPEIYMAFMPPASSPGVGPTPALANGYITFGSFNALAKITPQVVRTWSKILHALPTSRLLMLTVPQGRTHARVLEEFAAHGITSARLEFQRRLPFQQFLAAHGRADVALDPFPFHGTTTTCQTLWMGVPVITLAGRSHVSRVGATMLSSVGLAQCIAGDEEQYVARAVARAGDVRLLQELRAGMRQRMLGSPLTHGERLTRYLEDAYAKMWEDYCRQSSGAAR